jgi:hypothetical protein
MENFIYRGYLIDYSPYHKKAPCTYWEWTAQLLGDDLDAGVGMSPSREAAMAAVDFDISLKRPC